MIERVAEMGAREMITGYGLTECYGQSVQTDAHDPIEKKTTPFHISTALNNSKTLRIPVPLELASPPNSWPANLKTALTTRLD